MMAESKMWFNKFKLLCWKNWILVKRHYIAGFFEMIFPVLIVVIFIYCRDALPSHKTEEERYPPFPIAPDRCIFNFEPINKLAFSPDSDFVENLVKSAFKNRYREYHKFNDSSSLREFITNASLTEPLAAIEFESANLTKHFKYTIRLPQANSDYLEAWNIDQLFSLELIHIANLGPNGIPRSPPYQRSCFLEMQNKLDQTFMKQLRPEAEFPNVVLQAYPDPPVTIDIFVQFASSVFPFLFVCCMILSMKNLVKNVTIETEMQLKESMRMMGLTRSMYWSSWYMRSMTMLIISFTINCVLMCTRILVPTPMFYRSNPMLIWIFFVLYINSVIFFCFLICVTLKKSTRATNIGSFLFIACIVPYNFFYSKFHSFPYILKALYCLIPNTNMGQGLFMILLSEGRDKGLGFSNMWTREIDMNFSFAEILLFMILGCVLLIALTVYVENVSPGEYGIAKPYYFPLDPLLKSVRKHLRYRTLSNETILRERRISNSAYEDEPDSFKIGIQIKNLSKRFEDKYAVNNLSLNLFEDQICVLLGHNGAGKTTTMSMLSGLYSPTSGTAFLDGKDIRTQPEEARKSFGICPQNNVLFNELTVAEHLIFFCCLKGVTNEQEIKQEVQYYTNLLELSDKTNEHSANLSGGMKRKLSVGIALCGKAKICILDEPTSGMDPGARRALWDLLISEKKGRTVLLSTHFMEEADILGDRIAIMSEGQLRTVGSSFFLKKKFGTGYKLTCVKGDNFNSDATINLLKEYAPDVYLHSEIATEVTYIINENRLPIFGTLFKKIEDSSDELGISTFGCNLSTLEEVFIKLAHESCHDDDIEHDSQPTSLEIPKRNDSEKVTGMRLLLNQVHAMLYKKTFVFIRNWTNLIFLVFMSALSILLFLNTPGIGSDDEKFLKISFDSYGETETIFNGDSSKLVESYENLFNGKDHISTVGGNIEDYILRKANESLAAVNHQFLIGATFSSYITAWFNGYAYHSLPLTINTINRAIIKSILGSEYDITVTNHPYTMPSKTSDGHSIPNASGKLVLILLLIYTLHLYWTNTFIGHYIKERNIRAKLLQFISGTNRILFWLTSFVFDYIILLVISSIILGGIFMYQQTHFSSFSEFLDILGTIQIFSISFFPFMYAFSFLFKNYSTGESLLVLTGFLAPIVYGIIALLKTVLENKVYAYIAKGAYWIGLLIPYFSLTELLKNYGFNVVGFNAPEDNGTWPLLLMSLLSAFIFMSLIFMKEYHVFERFAYHLKRIPISSDSMDNDVLAETEKVKEMTNEQIHTSNLVLKGLTKYYGNFLAVNQLYLDVERCECFGLLGINGAGKTSTFKMLTGDEVISEGDAYIQGISVKNNLGKIHKMIGYCSQFDALIPELTGYETLKIFSLLRGIPAAEINESINHLSHELGFHQHLQKQVKAFSGGNKRKLSLALAVLGKAQLIFLDEPTTGIDPQAKRLIWNSIKKIVSCGHTVILTSHSMDECEALCSKIGIMVSGEFRCLGSVQHLKNKYSKGYILTVKLQRDDENLMFEVQNRINFNFPSAQMKEKYIDILTFHIENAELKWSQVFAYMEQLKKETEISHYTLTQMSLEQVFLHFSKISTNETSIKLNT